MDDSVARYRRASEDNDIESLMGTLAPDVEVVSPISGRMVFSGQADVRVLLAAVYGTIGDLHWEEPVGQGDRVVLFGSMRIGPLRMTDAMVFDLDANGRIRKISPHLRPWLGLTLFAAVLGPKVGRHPGIVRRALAGESERSLAPSGVEFPPPG